MRSFNKRRSMSPGPGNYELAYDWKSEKGPIIFSRKENILFQK